MSNHPAPATCGRAQSTGQPCPDHPAPEPTVTVTVAQLEAALRKYLAWLDYDLHKGIECGEEDGKDTYSEEAATLFGHLRKAAGGEQA